MDAGEKLLGLILAGGAARRLGGRDKALLDLGGQTLLARVAAALRPQCAVLLLNANGDGARFAATGLPVVADDVPDRPGPLAGILAGLDWAAREQPQLDAVLCVAVDTPFLPPDLARRLSEARGEGASVAAAASGGRRHPTVALWDVSLRHDLRRMLADGVRRMETVLDRLGAASVPWSDTPSDPFRNINTAGDLAAAAASLETERSPR